MHARFFTKGLTAGIQALGANVLYQQIRQENAEQRRYDERMQLYRDSNAQQTQSMQTTQSPSLRPATLLTNR